MRDTPLSTCERTFIIQALGERKVNELFTIMIVMSNNFTPCIGNFHDFLGHFGEC